MPCEAGGLSTELDLPEKSDISIARYKKRNIADKMIDES